MRKLIFALAMLLLASPAFGKERVWGWCAQGSIGINVGGVGLAVPPALAVYPSCTVLVTVTAQPSNKPTIYKDNAGSALTDPFTASSNGYWEFYVAGGRYDVTLSGGTPAPGVSPPFTYADILVCDPLGPSPDTCGGTLTSVTFTGDNVVDSSTPSTPVTTSGTLTATIISDSGNKVVATPADGSSGPLSRRVLVAADLPTSAGTVKSIATVLPITGGTITATGTIGCATCAVGPGTSTANHLVKFANTDGVTLADGGGTAVTSVGLSGTANQVTVTGATPITGSGSWTLSLPAAISLGTDNSTAGTLTLANGGSNAHTIWASGATTTNTIKGFATVPTNGHVVTCTTSGTICTLTDSGAAVTGSVVYIWGSGGTPLVSPHTVGGVANMVAGILSVVFTGPEVFTSAATYFCTANDADASGNAVRVAVLSGNSVNFSETTGGTNGISFSCTGN